MADLPFGFSSGEDPDKPGKKDPDSGSNPSDPFAAFGISGEFGMGDLGQIFTQLGQMFSSAGSASAGGSDSGPVNYELARRVASNSIGFVAPIPATTNSAIADAVHLAETWLDGATALPAGTAKAVGWTPADWVDNTLETWKRLCDPMAQQISTVWAASLPEEAKSMAGPLLQMMSQMGGMAFGSQLGQALGRLSREVLTSTDIGLPLGPKGIAAILPDAVESFASGLERPRSEILTFLAAREAAHHRLFSHVPWLASQLLGAVEAYAMGMQIDMSGIEELARDFNPASLSDPAAIENLLGQGVFEPKATPAQTQALERLETLLALIEGWVQVVVAAALGDRIPGAAALRASGGPDLDVRHAGRAGAAAPQDARSRRVVGAPHRGRRGGRPRRHLATPRPAARRRRPRRPRGVHRPGDRRRHQRHRRGDRPARAGGPGQPRFRRRYLSTAERISRN